MARFQYPSLTQPLVAAGEAIAESKWHQPWAEPVRERVAPRLAVALIAWGLAYVGAAPFAEAVTEARWHQPWSEPVRVRPRLPDGEQQFLALPPWPDVRIGWHAPLAEPVRTRPPVRIPAQEQQFQPFDEDIIFVDRWFAWWSEPVRVRPALRAGLHAALAFHPQPFPVVPGSCGWWPDGRTTEDGRQRTDETRSVVRRQSSVVRPRQVEPKVEPPTFAQVLGSQKPAQLADALGSAFARRLGDLRPPALDLWLPASAQAPAAEPPAMPAAALDAIADGVQARDAIEALQALDELDNQEREAVVNLLVRIANSE